MNFENFTLVLYCESLHTTLRICTSLLYHRYTCFWVLSHSLECGPFEKSVDSPATMKSDLLRMNLSLESHVGPNVS